MSYQEDFKKSYNNFDIRPLLGQTLQDFFIDDFCKSSIKEITTVVENSEQYKKMLIIGHRGCGKSTILNRAVEELNDDYHVVSFSASDLLNMSDVETVDILFVVYLQLLKSVENNWLMKLLAEDKTIENFFDFVKQPLGLTAEIKDVDFLNIISFKFRIEEENRAKMRGALHGQTKELIDNIDKICKKISTQKGKELLIIIDDLDKLELNFSKKIFFDSQSLLIMPKVKIIYTFPLDTYYCDDYIDKIIDRYEDIFIPIVNLNNIKGTTHTDNINHLWQLIYRRIPSDLVNRDAGDYLIKQSGGLLRDLVKFMQNACKFAISENKKTIDMDIANRITDKCTNDYYRVFDSAKYGDALDKISPVSKKEDNEMLVYFLRHLFVLEYRDSKDIWYDIHPCLKRARSIRS